MTQRDYWIHLITCLWVIWKFPGSNLQFFFPILISVSAITSMMQASFESTLIIPILFFCFSFYWLLVLPQGFLQSSPFSLVLGISSPKWVYESCSENNGNFHFLKKNIYLFVALKIVPIRYYAFVPALLPIIETLLKIDLWNTKCLL